MNQLNYFAKNLGVDISKISPFSSEFDRKLEMANQAVINWMKDPDNKAYLDDKKASYIHDKGWSIYNGKRGNVKHEYDIPQEAFLLLPFEIRNDKKELKKWVLTYHPYLMHSKIV